MWSFKIRLVPLLTLHVVVLLLLFLVVPQVTSQLLPPPGFYCDPPVPNPGPNSDGTETIPGHRSDNTGKLNSIRWLLGCKKVASSWTTYQEINAYYLKKQKEKKDRYLELNARRAPFCVTSDLKHQQFTKFKDILTAENKKDLKARSPLPIWDPRDVNNPVFLYGLKRISFLRIHTGHNPVPYLRQWLHIKLVFDTPIQGLFIQAISGPLGVPFGQFSLDFNCQDVKDGGAVMNFKTFYQNPAIIPCKYRPGSALRHPDVFVFGGEKDVTVTPRTEFHVHFSWIDALCGEAPFVQFMFIAVKDFGKPTDGYLTFNSPVYDHTTFDSLDGAPYPFYFGWEKQMSCDKEERDPEAQFISDSPALDLQYDFNVDNFDNFNTNFGMDEHPQLDLKEPAQDEYYDNRSHYHQNPSADHRKPIGNWRVNGTSTLEPLIDNVDKLNAGNSGRRRSRRSLPYKCSDKNLCIHHQFTADINKVIRYSKEFDDCILSNKGLIVNTRVCPPGPFACKKNIAVDIETRLRIRKAASKITKPCDVPCNFSDAEPTSPVKNHGRAAPVAAVNDVPPEQFTGPPPPPPPGKGSIQLIDETMSFERNLEMHYRDQKRIHGWFMIFAFLVIIPGINFISRFYKETGSKNRNGCFELFGFPVWLLRSWVYYISTIDEFFLNRFVEISNRKQSHVGMSYLAVIIIWVGLGITSGYPFGGTVDCSELEKQPRLPNYEEHSEVCQKYRSSALIHVVFGGLAILIFHKELIDGWIRSQGRKKRNLIMGLHCIGGYLAHVLAGISALTVRSCEDIFLLICSLIGATIVIFVVGCGLQLAQDRKLQLKLPRRWFPVYEAIEIRPNPPLRIIKLIILLVQWILHLILLLIISISYGMISDNDKGEDKKNEYKFNGLFGTCSAIGTAFFHKRIICKEFSLDACDTIYNPTTSTTPSN